MGTINDLWVSYLKEEGYEGGGYNTLTLNALREATGTSKDSVNTLWYLYLTGLGYSGTINDMQYKWLGDNGYTGSLNDRWKAALEDGFSFFGFDPLSLFEEGQQGAWYDPSDLSTLFQDSAGTTPVTADGDPVGLMLDKSGNDNHASQSTTAAKPTREAPGISPDTSDYMDIDQSLNHEAFTACVAVQLAADNQRIIDNRGTGSAGTVPGWHIKSGAANDCALVDDGAGHIWRWPFLDSAPAGTPRILTLRYAPNSGLFRIDGQPISPGNTSSSMGSILSPVDGNLFTASNSIGTQNFTGKFLGGIVVSEAVSDQDVDRIERYLSSITGVPLP